MSIAGVVSDVQSAGGKVYIDGSDPDIDDSYQVDGRGSQLEPVKNLQTLFKKKHYKQRQVGTNYIMEKYKRRTNSMGSKQFYEQNGHLLS